MTPAQRNTVNPRLVLILAAFAFGAGIAAVRTHYGAADFDVFWAAARHWQAPYDPQVIADLKAQMHIEGHWPFAYPPTFLLFAWPFGQLPLALAYPLWAGLSMALFMLASSFMVRPTWGNLLLFLTPPVVFAAAPGQTTLLVGAAAIGGFLLLEKRPLLAGVLFALAACIKPQAMILAPVILWGRWPTVGAATVTGLALVGLSCLFGPQLWLQWPAAVTSFGGIIDTTHRINPSALIDSPLWAAPLAAFGVYLAWSSKNLFGLVGGALCCTPYAHDYDLAPLAPLAVSWLLNRKDFGWGHVAAGGVFLTGLLRSPLLMLLFLIGVAVIQSPWWPFRAAKAEGAPVARSPFQKLETRPEARRLEFASTIQGSGDST